MKLLTTDQEPLPSLGAYCPILFRDASFYGGGAPHTLWVYKAEPFLKFNPAPAPRIQVIELPDGVVDLPF